MFDVDKQLCIKLKFMSKLFYHMAGHKPTAQEQLCSFNPAPFSEYRAKCSGRLSLGRAFTAHIS